MDEFYSDSDNHADGLDLTATTSHRPGSGPHNDPRLLEKVWQWLTCHPDIFIGNDRSNNRLSLAEFEAAEASDASSSLKIFSSEERMWYALTDHGKDLKRVPQMEFELLSLIACYGKAGILQPMLVKISGQDSRSVPKRTDNLLKKDLILKEGILTNNTRTTRLMLKRFDVRRIEGASAGDSKEVFVNGCLAYDHLLDYLLESFPRFNNILSLPELHKRLVGYFSVLILDLRNIDIRKGITGKRWETIAVRRAIGRLQRLGVIERVLARPKDNPKRWYKCIKLLQPPTIADRKAFSLFPKEEVVKRPKVDRLEDLAGLEELESDGDVTMDGADNLIDPELLVDVPRLPGWSPGLPLTNILFSAIESAGPRGVNSMALADLTVGKFWKRPLDVLLGKFTDMWSSSQPPHLRHLAIVRDTAITKQIKGVHYLYRTFENFERAVELNDTSWDVLLSATTGTNRLGKKKITQLEEPELDEWGFPQTRRQPFVGGLLSVADSVRSKKPHLGKLYAQTRVTYSTWQSEFQHQQSSSATPHPTSAPPPKKRGRPPKQAKKADDKPDSIQNLDPNVDVAPNVAIDQPQNSAPSEPPPPPPAPTLSKTPMPKSSQSRSVATPNSRTPGYKTFAERKEEVWLQRQEQNTREQALRMARNEAKENLGYCSSSDEDDERPKTAHAAVAAADTAATNTFTTVNGSITNGANNSKDSPSSAQAAISRKRPAPTSDEERRSSRQDIAAAGNQVELQTPTKPPARKRGRPPKRARITAEIEASALAEQQLLEESLARSERLRSDATEQRLESAQSTLSEQAPKDKITSTGPLDAASSISSQGIPLAKPKTKKVSKQDVDAAIQEDRVQEFIRRLKERPKPGVYVNPPGCEKPQVKGHQPKHLIVVFASDKLKELESFVKEAHEQGPPRVYAPQIVMDLWARREKEGVPVQVQGNAQEEGHDQGNLTRSTMRVPKAVGRPRMTAARRAFLERTSTPFTPRQLTQGAETPGFMQHSSATPVTTHSTPDIRTGLFTSREDSVSQNSQVPFYPELGTPTIRHGVESTPIETPFQSFHQEPPIEDPMDLDDSTPAPAANVSRKGKARFKPNRGPFSRDINPTTDPSPKKSSRSKIGQSLQGKTGGVMHKRTRLTLHILDLAGGVLPGYVLRKVFEALWPTYYGKKDGGKPDHSTIRKSFETMAQGGKVREMRFGFRRGGVSEIGYIIMLPHIAPNSPAVVELQQNMKAHKSYVPERFVHIVRPATSGPMAQRKDYFAEVDDPFVKKHEQYLVRQDFVRSEKRQEAQELRAAERALRKRLERITDVEADFGRKRRRRNFKFLVDTKDSIFRELQLEQLHPTLENLESEIVAEMARVAENDNSDSENENERQNRGIDPSLDGVRRRLSMDEDESMDDEDSDLSEDEELSVSLPLAPSSMSAQESQRKIGSDRNVMQVHIPAPYNESVDMKLSDLPPWETWSCINREWRAARYQTTVEQTSLTHPRIIFHEATGTFGTDFHVVNHVYPYWTFAVTKLQQDWENTIPHNLDELIAAAPNYKYPKERYEYDSTYIRFRDEIEKTRMWEKKQIKMMRKAKYRPWELRMPRFINHSVPVEQFVTTEELYPSSYVPPSWGQDELKLAKAKLPKLDGPAVSVVETAPNQDDNANIPRPRGGRKLTMALPVARALTAPRTRQPHAVRKTNKPKKPVRSWPKSEQMEMSAEDTRVLTYVIVVCRTLAGGPRGTVPWPLVCEVLRDYPNLDQQTLKNRWTWVRGHFNAFLDGLTESFQEAFLKACERGEMPLPDYNRLEDYDWNHLVDWALKGLSTNEDELIDLPADRETFDESYELRERRHEGEGPREKIYRTDTLEFLRKKEFTNLVYCAPVTSSKPKIKQEEEEQKVDLMLARSWVRANNATPNEQYDNLAAHAKLEPLGETILAKATEELAANRIFKEKMSRRIVPGRNWDFSKFFISAFERDLNPAIFEGAIKFKLQLDEAFATVEPYTYSLSPAALDRRNGYTIPVDLSPSMAIVLINLASSGHVVLCPDLPPTNHTFGAPWPRLSKWGHLEKRWKGVSTDRERLQDDIIVLPTRTYTPGPLVGINTTTTLPPPPVELDVTELGRLLDLRGSTATTTTSPSNTSTPVPTTTRTSQALHAIQDKTLLPLWSTIHKSLLPQWWRRFLAALLHVMATRAGLDTAGLVTAMKGIVDEWEVGLGLKWLEKVGVVERVKIPKKERRSESDGVIRGKGWVLKDGWWAVVAATAV